jgi:glutaminyl-peptide cyclotransferase
MMRRIVFLIFILFISFVFICSCSGKTEKSRKPVSSIVLFPAAKNYVFGQSVTINVNTKLKNGQLKKVDVFLNNKLITSDNKLQFTYTIQSLNELGLNTMRIVPEKTDGVVNPRSIVFTVLSDIVPQKYDFTVVREYKHSVEHFTQGLQIFNGFLFEGTGENGNSNVFKINLSSNSVIQRTALPEKYFGEGITVMQNKIYQLTYKQQTGFVYNVSDFALVDSFRFESLEGWGLTNDGKSLIMSDGTGILTWLNPENFSVEKRIQVADREKVLQNINELEYDKGFIWANIWTTDQIIKIDANTGKVIGFLDLKGILSIMNTNSSQRIDVLNGIALFPETNHLLVTGKLWPKMFEIKLK